MGVAERRAGRSARRGRSARGRPCRSSPSRTSTPPAIVSPATDERAHLREARIHRVDRPVVEDHGSTNLRDRDSRRRDRPQARALRSALARRRPRRGADRPAHRSRLLLGHEPAGPPGRAGRRRAACCSCGACSSGRGPSRRSSGSSRCGRSPRSRPRSATAGLESGRADRPRARRAAGARSTSATAAGCPTTSSSDCSPAVRRVRARKSDWELARMRAAAEQVRRGAEAVPALIRPGVTESQVQLEVERVLRLAGHQGQLRFRGFNQEMHYGQVLGRPERRRARLLRLAAVRPRPQPGARQGPGRPRARGRRPGDRRPRRRPRRLAGRPDPHVRGRQRSTPTCVAAYDCAVAILRAVEAELRPGAVPASALYDLAEGMAADAGLERALHGRRRRSACGSSATASAWRSTSCRCSRRASTSRSWRET